VGINKPWPLLWQHALMKKKRSESRKHCALAVVRRSQKISPSRRPLPGGAGRPKFNQLELVTTFTYKPSSVRIDACNFDLSWYRPTNTPTNTQTHTQINKPIDRTDYNTLRLTITLSLACSVIRPPCPNYPAFRRYVEACQKLRFDLDDKR